MDYLGIDIAKDKFDVYKRITDEWNEHNKLGADYETYKVIVSRDIS